MNILYLAYACEPGAGSEYGVGWMAPLTVARRHPALQVHVLTRSRCRSKIEQAVLEEGLPNLHFHFRDLPGWLVYPNEMQSRWGEQINYLAWQLGARRWVRQMHQRLHFDVMHHLTFNQYRTPSPGFWAKTPFVMGPIGGAETIAPAFWQDLEPHTLRKERIRLRGRDLGLFRWLCKRSDNRKLILCSSGENLARLSPYAEGAELRQMPAIAFEAEGFASSAPPTQKADAANAAFTLIYAGKALDWKGIRIFLRAAGRWKAQAKDLPQVRILLVGIRSEEEQEKVNRWAREAGVSPWVELIPFIQRAELLQMMRTCDLSIYPAFRDSGSMSVLEACALACPTVCFAAGGQDVFPDEILLKVPVGESYEACVEALTQRLEWACAHPAELQALGQRAQAFVREALTWERRADDFVSLYRELTQA